MAKLLFNLFYPHIYGLDLIILYFDVLTVDLQARYYNYNKESAIVLCGYGAI